MASSNIPEKTIERLSEYRRTLLSCHKQGITHIFSHVLAGIHGITAVQVRRDLMLIGFSSDTKKGYDVKVLLDFISNILDSDTVTNIAVIGMGHLGQAITKYFNGRGLKLKITTAFDERLLSCDPPCRFSGTPCPIPVSDSVFPYSDLLACCLKIYCVVHGFQPFIGGFVPRNLYCQMREPAIRCCAVPVLYTHRNIYYIVRAQLLCRFAPFLIVTSSGHADEDLSSAHTSFAIRKAAHALGQPA